MRAVRSICLAQQLDLPGEFVRPPSAENYRVSAAERYRPLSLFSGFVEFACLFIEPHQALMCGDEVWVHIQRVAADLDGHVIVTLAGIGPESKRSVRQRERIKLAGALHLLQGVFNAPAHCQKDPIPGMGSRVTRVEFDGAAEFLLRAAGSQSLV